MRSRSRLAQAYYDVAMLLDAGVPILRSLDVVIQGRQGSFQRVFTRIRESIAKGSSLAESMGEHRTVFPELDRMLVEAAETSGRLGDSFKMLSHWHEFIHRMTQRMLAGLIYPVLILHVAAMIFPLPQMILGGTSLFGYFRSVLGLVVLFFYLPVAVILALAYLRERVAALRLPLDSLVLMIPILGSAVYHLSVCRYARAFGMLYKAGVPISECTERATRATGNAAVARLFAGGAESVHRGHSAWEGFSRRLSAEYLNLWQVGEESGELDKTVDKIAEISADRAEVRFQHAAYWLPLAFYLVIAIRIAFMIVTMAGRIWNFSDFEF